jgi:hypothetical protein
MFLTLSLIFVISCAHGPALKQEEINPWLNTISGGKPPEIDITGKWKNVEGTSRWGVKSDAFGFGEGYLHQEKNKISGAIGDYSIEGVVSGKIVYFVFLYNGAVHYTARLEMLQDSLTGNYFHANDKEQIRGFPTSFVRTAGPTRQ